MGVNVIMAGDFGQILSIGESGGHDAYIKLICKNLLTLTKYKRGSLELLNALNKVRDRYNVLDFDRGEKGSLHFCFTNATRDMINAREIAKVKSEYTNLPSGSILTRIYPNMPLRSNKTKENGDWLNNERWVLLQINDSSVYIKNDRIAHHISIKELQDNFVPGYAMTIHSSQGLTISEPYTLWIEQNTKFSKDEEWRLIYTALSRAKERAQIGIVLV